MELIGKTTFPFCEMARQFYSREPLKRLLSQQPWEWKTTVEGYWEKTPTIFPLNRLRLSSFRCERKSWQRKPSLPANEISIPKDTDSVPLYLVLWHSGRLQLNPGSYAIIAWTEPGGSCGKVTNASLFFFKCHSSNWLLTRALSRPSLEGPVC